MIGGTAVFDQALVQGDRGLSPRRVRFWLHHWQELDTLADGGPGTRNLREYLAREWALLQERAGICLCGPTDQEAPLAGDFGRADYLPASMRYPDLRAQLVMAADALPLPWRATRAVFEQQGRADTWGVRLAAYRLHHATWPREQDRESEPDGSGIEVTLRMAEATGWTPRRRVA